MSFYFSIYFKAFLVCRDENKITTFESIAFFYENIDSKERQQSDCLIYLNTEKNI